MDVQIKYFGLRGLRPFGTNLMKICELEIPSVRLQKYHLVLRERVICETLYKLTEA